MGMWNRRKIFNWLGKYLMTTAIATVGAVFCGFFPKTITGWLIILVFGVPIWFIGEWMGGKITDERISKSIDPSKRAVSPARLFYLLFAMLIYLGGLLLVWGIFEELIRKHFYVLKLF